MDSWTPIHSTTVQEIEDYMRSLNLPEKAPQKGANSKQVSGSHYSDKEIQPWDYIHANNLCYFTGNCVKYVSRWRDKGGIDDLKKAIHYLEKLIELEQGK
jgi:Protein of unknwon function (DUF3310)